MDSKPSTLRRLVCWNDWKKCYDKYKRQGWETSKCTRSDTARRIDKSCSKKQLHLSYWCFSVLYIKALVGVI